MNNSKEILCKNKIRTETHFIITIKGDTCFCDIHFFDTSGNLTKASPCDSTIFGTSISYYNYDSLNNKTKTVDSKSKKKFIEMLSYEYDENKNKVLLNYFSIDSFKYSKKFVYNIKNQLIIDSIRENGEDSFCVDSKYFYNNKDLLMARIYQYRNGKSFFKYACTDIRGIPVANCPQEKNITWKISYEYYKNGNLKEEKSGFNYENEESEKLHAYDSKKYFYNSENLCIREINQSYSALNRKQGNRLILEKKIKYKYYYNPDKTLSRIEFDENNHMQKATIFSYTYYN